MSELTNLTDRLAHLRDRKSGSQIMQTQNAPKSPKPSKQKSVPINGERRMATDYFMLFVYALLAASIACQFGLIIWLDL